MTRLGRKVAEAFASYSGEPAESRARIDAGFAALQPILGGAGPELISKATRDLFLEAVIMVVVEGYVGGNWPKVHASIAEAVPELYVHLKDILPGGAISSSLAL